MSHKESSNFLPVFLDVAGKNVLVVGAGDVARRKIEVLLKYNLKITILAPEINKEIEALSLSFKDKITIIKDVYSDKYLEKEYYIIVFAATNDANLNNEISSRCNERGLAVNNITFFESCSFIMPAIIKKNDFQIAISTSGKAPYVSKFIKKELEENFIPEAISYIPLIEKIRDVLKDKKNIDDELKIKLYEKVLKSKNLMTKLYQEENNLSKALNLLIEELK